MLQGRKLSSDRRVAVRALVQRVSRAAVRIAGEGGSAAPGHGVEVAAIAQGLLILLGVGPSDDVATCERLADKVSRLRIFGDADGKVNLSVSQVGGSCLVVSQFTLYGDLRSGNRPGFSRAAPPELAEALYRRFAERLEHSGLPVRTGRFGQHMEVELVNDGPITLWLDTDEL